MANAAPPKIDTMPTKAFFVDMLVRDIQLERAVLDLVDNSVDGAKRLRPASPLRFEGLAVSIEMNADRFTITDNCGGFDVNTATNYAFRFGRPADAGRTPYSIGQFGVGMKRALFKFGHWFTVISASASERWTIEVDVTKWESSDKWEFEFTSIETDIVVPEADRATTITVKRLRSEVASKFGSEHFARTVSEMIRTHQRQFIAAGLGIKFNGISLTATDIRLRDGDVSAGVQEFEDVKEGQKTVKVRIVAGADDSNPSAAGWYVVCNGRIVLAADRSEVTGWGRVAEQGKEIPKYHNQYARFRGVAYFDCEDAGRLPWNTTKDGVDTDSEVWRLALERMIVQSRAVINFLNDVDKEIEAHGKDGPIQKALAASPRKEVDSIRSPKPFKVPDPALYSAPSTTRITYTRSNDQIDLLKDALGVWSAKAVGERTFDDAYREQKGA